MKNEFAFLDSIMGKPKPDDPNSKSPCSKCVGRTCGCFIISKRDPKKHCGAFARIGKNTIEFADGGKATF